MLRDGIEDYEYMVILKDLLEQQDNSLSEAEQASFRQLLEVPSDISASMTEFTWDPAPIEKRREAVARAIARISAQ